MQDKPRKRAKPAYYAISAPHLVERYNRRGERCHIMDWRILSGPHASREEAQGEGEKAISRDEYRQTLALNMRIVSKSELQKHDLKEEDAYDFRFTS